MRGKTRWGRRLLCLMPAPIALLILHMGARHPEWVEEHFSRGIYPIWATNLSRFSANLHSTVAEKLLVTLIAAVGFFALMRVIQSIVQRSARPMLQFLFHLICGAGGLYAVFVLTWGIQFARLPFANATGMQIRPTDGAALSALCDTLLKDAVAFRAGAAEDSNGAFALEESVQTMLGKIPAAFDGLAKQYPFLAGQYAQPKQATFHHALSEMQIMGIYIPFTGEALLNPGVPATQLAHTAAHESAHQRGYAREAEADYVGYLACMASDDLAIRYSGTLTMLRYAAQSLSEQDAGAYSRLCARFPAGINRDFAEQYDYWSHFDTPLSGLVDTTNKRYLHTFAFKTDASSQRDDVVSLLLARFQQGQ